MSTEHGAYTDSMMREYLLDRLQKLITSSGRHVWTVEEVWDVIGADWDVKTGGDGHFFPGMDTLNLDILERRAIDLAMRYAGGVQKKAALLLGISERRLCYKLNHKNYCR